MNTEMVKPRIAVHKFSSCDGCQLAFLNAGPALLELAELTDIVYFAEAGSLEREVEIDIAFVEGSISTPQDLTRIKAIRENSAYLITIGACATTGGLQGLRNLYASNTRDWTGAIYARPEFIETLDESQPVSSHVKVDLELWGCPVSTQQIMTALRALLFGVTPGDDRDKICMECKRRHNVCVLITKAAPCMGPVTRTGCGAICPAYGRDCYACYGPAENINAEALATCFEGLGLLPQDIARRFHFINCNAPNFKQAGTIWRNKS